MSGVLATMAHILSRNSPTGSTHPLSADRRHKPGAHGTHRSFSEGHNPRGIHTLDNPPRRKTSNPSVIGLFVDLDNLSEDDTICCPRNCSHCRSSPSPNLVYSSESCSTITLSAAPDARGDTSLSGSTLLGSPDRLVSFSPKGMTLSDGTSLLPLPELDAVTSNLAQRRGVKHLPALRPKHQSSSSISGSSKFGRLTSPLSPDTATAIAQRFVGFMRLSPRPDMRTPTPTQSYMDPLPEPGSPAREYTEDIFKKMPRGEMGTSFFDDEYLFDSATARPSDLADLTIYTRLPVLDGHYETEKCTWHNKPRLYIGVSGIHSPVLTALAEGKPLAPVLQPGPRPPKDRKPPVPSQPRPAGPPKQPEQTEQRSTTPTLTRPEKIATSPRTVTKATRTLRPLLLAEKLAQQDIADALAPSTTSKLRPLYLPQQLARRASHPPRRPTMASARANTFPFSGPSPAHVDVESQARRPEIEGLISLLGLQAEGTMDESMVATIGSGDSIIVDADAESDACSVLTISATESASALPMAEVPVSSQVGDILELLTRPVTPRPRTSASLESIAVRASVCAYAL